MSSPPAAVPPLSESLGPSEPPILLMKLRLAADAADNFPSDISPFSVFASEQEWAFPPGVYLEQKKEWTESIGGTESIGLGDTGTCKLVEVAPYISPSRRGVMAALPVKKA